MLRAAIVSNLLLALAGTIGAQGTRSVANADSALGAAIARLKPASWIRLHLSVNGRIEGQLHRASATTLAVVAVPAPSEYSISAIDTLWVRGNSAKRGALIGGIAGVSAGVAFGVFANEVGCKDDSGDPCPEAIPIMGLAGAAAGALLGALIGSAFPQWHRRVP